MAATAVLFDLDGTIWDSYPWYACVLAGAGIAAANTLKELRAGGNIIALHRNCGISGSRFQSLCAECADRLQLYPHVRDSLNRLSQRRTPMGVVTSLPGWLAELLILTHNLDPYFQTVIHAGNCCSRKPRPGPLHAGLTEMGRSADQTAFYIGDSEGDAKAAIAAGISFAWASYGYGASKPDCTSKVLRSFGDVLLL